MLSVDDAQARLLADAQLTAPVELPIGEALGAILAQDVVAPINVPPADNSAMDGYAIRLADFSPNQALPVSQRIPAGVAPEPLLEGSAARIFTGAELPAGADCVVAQEDCRALECGVVIEAAPVRGQHIRPTGQDIAMGDAVFSKGHKLQAADLGLLASLGICLVLVRKGLRIALMSTGDELVEPGQALSGAQIYNSNRPMLAALLRQLGHEVVDLGIVPDNAEATRLALQEAAEKADVVISSGGVSVGEEDHVKAQLEALGSLDLWKLAIKPGKPLAYGRLRQQGTSVQVPFFGLPGNPVSSFVTFLLLVKPYLLQMQGKREVLPSCWPVKAGFDWPKPGSRQEYLRVQIQRRENEIWAMLYPQQSSGALSSVSWSNALAVIPIGATYQRGDLVDAIFLDQFTQ